VPEPPATLPLTGERTVPGVPEENYWFRRHEAAYRWAVPWAAGKRVLEVGCGEGYGADLIGGVAHEIVGLDYDPLTVAHAATAYPGRRFVRGNLAALPVRSATVDVLATLQVIEHVWDHREFLHECRRVLRPGGRLVVTTPNRLTFSPGLDEPVNPFHTREFTAAELAELVTGCGFAVEATLGLHAGPRLAALDDAFGGSFVTAQLSAPPERWTAALRRAVESVRAADFLVLDGAERPVDASLDLVLLARPA
jgi:SAM-dependent methyltransferase